MILIAGGTGRLGSLVANQLCERGLNVRVLSRGLKPDPGILLDGIEVVAGDVRDPTGLTAALEGVDVVLSAVQGFMGLDGVTPETVDRMGNINLVAAAESVGADIVMMSVIGASPDSPMELFRMKYAAEQRLLDSTTSWTVVRSDAYAETWLAVLEETAGKSGRPLVFGRGDRPISWVSVHDVAALVELAVTDSSLRGRILEICGPEPVTLTELAARFMSERGVAGKPRRVPRVLLHVVAGTVGRVRPTMRRQARASLAMDVLPTSDGAATRAEFPDLPSTPVSAVVEATLVEAD